MSAGKVSKRSSLSALKFTYYRVNIAYYQNFVITINSEFLQESFIFNFFTQKSLFHFSAQKSFFNFSALNELFQFPAREPFFKFSTQKSNFSTQNPLFEFFQSLFYWEIKIFKQKNWSNLRCFWVIFRIFFGGGWL